ncbi:hypothetical protein VB773_22630 [Haloarculaceae archaeon H-GB2-1]|nr:hypothetical protein [Haloarculaceae archaeon H-GB1-1]MEA5410097.1 hypothetical protein [Haloarculaceae archaeon H-GB2-1]
MDEIDRATSAVSHNDVRTELQSISAVLQEVLDAAVDEPTDGDVAFADLDFEGSPANAATLTKIEDNLVELAANADDSIVQSHLATAQRAVERYRITRFDEE